jgi:hypothetical protein
VTAVPRVEVFVLVAACSLARLGERNEAFPALFCWFGRRAPQTGGWAGSNAGVVHGVGLC